MYFYQLNGPTASITLIS